MKERYELLDALRGLSILLMVAYHAGIDLVTAGYLPVRMIDNLTLHILQPLFAGLFILLAGASSRFSRNNWKRGLITLGCAAAVTAVSVAAQAPIWFGILHLLSLCMLLYAAFPRILNRIPLWVSAPLFFVFYFFVPWWPVVPSMDWFPVFPWIFVFLSGLWLGDFIRRGGCPAWFYGFHMPVLPAIGRRTLLIYMLHQPVLYGVLAILNTINA